MRYVSTRGGPAVAGLEAVSRGMSRTGGLFVPEHPPQPLSLSSLADLSFQSVMAVFYQRFLPELTLEIWEDIVGRAFRSLTDPDEQARLPLSKLNDYLDHYFLIHPDHLPTGSLADLSAAVFSALLPYLPRTGREPLIMALLPEDQLVALAGGVGDPAKLMLLAGNSSRGSELADRLADHEEVRVFQEDFDQRYREFSLLAADETFEAKLGQAGFDPLFVGPGYLLDILTSGALATAALVSALPSWEEGTELDFAIPKNHLSFLAGLVYASSLQVPVGSVYVGEGEPGTLTYLFRTGRLASPSKGRRRRDRDASFPVNLERLLFEVTGRNGSRTGDLSVQPAGSEDFQLTEEEIHLLNQSILVGSCDYKYCLRLIRTVYDQTDYLIGRDAADAIACWVKHSNKKTKSAIRYVKERSPLLDADPCARPLSGKGAKRENPVGQLA